MQCCGNATLGSYLGTQCNAVQAAGLAIPGAGESDGDDHSFVAGFGYAADEQHSDAPPDDSDSDSDGVT
ncbi:hypothetical protein CYMTET_6871 [Cymbomonas tetramitiformis]|uniref:Uncharacterized protein n=1 Tax=Cymbomonas tetramitiformis TaxID=36881 RepID=A0AAE0LI01_9CHLO|nr:hypothetical protein CYMTET_6871 [Cymbomonas tetramitiformis]